jgi:hypothetical protein
MIHEGFGKGGARTQVRLRHYYPADKGHMWRRMVWVGRPAFQTPGLQFEYSGVASSLLPTIPPVPG